MTHTALAYILLKSKDNRFIYSPCDTPEGLTRGYLFWGHIVAVEPAVKRTVVFVDGQNLFYGAKIAFGYLFPNYDILPLATTLCQQHGWQLTEARFYTGIPDATDNAF